MKATTFHPILGTVLAWLLSQADVMSDDFTTDFEAGYLRGWTRTGTAFETQPVSGDNPTARGRGQPSNHAGTWWIGTYEDYQGLPGQTPGDVQDDAPTGTLTSPPFLLRGKLFTFLIGGGIHYLDDPQGATVVALEIGRASCRERV